MNGIEKPTEKSQGELRTLPPGSLGVRLADGVRQLQSLALGIWGVGFESRFQRDDDLGGRQRKRQTGKKKGEE